MWKKISFNILFPYRGFIVHNHQMLAVPLLYNLTDNAVFVCISPESPSALGFPLILFAEM